MTPEERIENLEKRLKRVERKVLNKDISELKYTAPRSKASVRSEKKYLMRKSIMGI